MTHDEDQILEKFIIKFLLKFHDAQIICCTKYQTAFFFYLIANEINLCSFAEKQRKKNVPRENKIHFNRLWQK